MTAGTGHPVSNFRSIYGKLINRYPVSGVRTAMCATNQLPGRGPTDVDDDHIPVQ